MLNILYNTKSPRCNSSKCFAYWDGKCSALVSSSFKGGCPFFKDKESKAAEDLRCKDRVEKWKASDVRNIRAYLITALYNAPLTIDSFYSAMVNHDMYGSK